MGWDPTQKTVIRLNGRNVGPIIWDLDAQASQVIDSVGHDLHDQDLADSISQCLHTGGYNSMTANLNMGGFRVTGMAVGTDSADAINLHQLYNDMTFDDQSRVLTLSSPAGGSVTAYIPSGAGGGSVTSIDLGVGITGIANPITGVGSVELAAVVPDPAGGYVNGIGAITVDQYGRVTEVVDGYGVGVDLGLTRDSVEAIITNTGGNNATIPGATTSLAGLLTATDKQKLDGVVQDVDLGVSTSSVSVTVTNTGGNNATIQEATSTRAGVMTTAMHDKLDDLNVVPAGGGTGHTLRWTGSEWESTNSLTLADPGGTSTLTTNLDIPGRDLACDEILCGGIRIDDSIPNMEWYDTNDPSGERLWKQQTGASSFFFYAATDAGSVGSKHFKFNRTGNQIDELQAVGGAVFNGPVTAQVTSYLTAAEREAIVDEYVTQGILTPARGTEVKNKMAADIAAMITDGVEVQIT